MKKIKIIKRIELTLKRVCSLALHKQDPGVYMIYMCGHVVYKERKNADMVEW